VLHATTEGDVDFYAYLKAFNVGTPVTLARVLDKHRHLVTSPEQHCPSILAPATVSLRFGVSRRRVIMSIEVIGSIYIRESQEGDFVWMAKQPEHARTLFVFNDNETQFRAFVDGSAVGLSEGGGNAKIRPLRGETPPRAAGIPTGDRSGYKKLDARTKTVIDEALEIVRKLVETGRYERIIFSRDKHHAYLGAGLFDPAEEVKQYIYDRLMALGSGGAE